MNEVIVIKRRKSWEWRVHDQHGRLLMSGRERTRPAARYQGYRSLFMLLAIGRAPFEPHAKPRSRKGIAATRILPGQRNPRAPVDGKSDEFTPD
jgi:hypothetical protein